MVTVTSSLCANCLVVLDLVCQLSFVFSRPDVLTAWWCWFSCVTCRLWISAKRSTKKAKAGTPHTPQRRKSRTLSSYKLSVRRASVVLARRQRRRRKQTYSTHASVDCAVSACCALALHFCMLTYISHCQHTLGHYRFSS